MATPGRDDADVIGRLLVSVYEIHERVIARGGGGLEGIRDAGLLHAAVARPFATFGAVELYPTDFDKAAALFHSLIKSHPFLDGTKRTAFAAAVYFLHEWLHSPTPIPQGRHHPLLRRVSRRRPAPCSRGTGHGADHQADSGVAQRACGHASLSRDVALTRALDLLPKEAGNRSYSSALQKKYCASHAISAA
jgi:hypothetical protein